jgi:hypothetical protein
MKPFTTLSNKSDLLKGITFLRVKTIRGFLLVSSRATFSSRCWITVSLNDPNRMIFPWAFVKCQDPKHNSCQKPNRLLQQREEVFYFLEFTRTAFKIRHDSNAINTMLLLHI